MELLICQVIDRHYLADIFPDIPIFLCHIFFCDIPEIIVPVNIDTGEIFVPLRYFRGVRLNTDTA